MSKDKWLKAADMQAKAEAYQAPAMYEKPDYKAMDKWDQEGSYMDMHAFQGDDYESTNVPQKKSSVQYNLEETFRQLDMVNENIDYLSKRLTDVLSPQPGYPTSDDSAEAGSNLGSKLNAVAYRLREYNQRIRSLAEAVDL